MTKRNLKRITSEPVTIPTTNGHQVIVDGILHPFLSQYRWRAVKYHRSFYARLAGTEHSKVQSVSMHRLIANTPTDMVCHHRNRNTLDNRKANLLNITKSEHELIHKNNTLLVKYDSEPPAASTPART